MADNSTPQNGSLIQTNPNTFGGYARWKLCAAHSVARSHSAMVGEVTRRAEEKRYLCGAIGCLYNGRGPKSQQRSVYWGSSPKIYVRGGAVRWLERWNLELEMCCLSLGMVIRGLRLHCEEVAAHQNTPMVLMYLLGQNAEAVDMEQWLRVQRKMSVVQNRAPCCRNTQQRVFFPLAIVVRVPQAVATLFWHGVRSAVHHLWWLIAAPGTRHLHGGWGTLLPVRIRISPGKGNEQGQTQPGAEPCLVSQQALTGPQGRKWKFLVVAMWLSGS